MLINSYYAILSTSIIQFFQPHVKPPALIQGNTVYVLFINVFGFEIKSGRLKNSYIFYYICKI